MLVSDQVRVEPRVSHTHTWPSPSRLEFASYLKANSLRDTCCLSFCAMVRDTEGKASCIRQGWKKDLSEDERQIVLSSNCWYLMTWDENVLPVCSAKRETICGHCWCPSSRTTKQLCLYMIIYIVKCVCGTYTSECDAFTYLSCTLITKLTHEWLWNLLNWAKQFKSAK